MLDAKTHLSRLIAEIEDHREDEIIIARNGTPVARIRALDTAEPDTTRSRVGAARGAFEIPDDIDSPFGDMSKLFSGAVNETPPDEDGSDRLKDRSE